MSDGQGGDAAAAAAAATGGGDGGAAAGAGGGVADLLTGGAAGDAAAGAAGTGGESGAADADTGGTPWYAALADKPAEGQTLSDKAWIENKKFGSVADLVKQTRELEARFLSGDKIVLPKDGDPPEALETFYKAIGRPEKPDDYEIKMPEGREIDQTFAKRMQERAFKAGAPKAMFEGIVEEFNQHMLEIEQNELAQRAEAKKQGIAKIRTEWGQDFDGNVQHANKAMQMLGLDKASIAGIEDGLEAQFPGEGTIRTMKLLAKLGSGMGEDSLLDPANPKVFGVTPSAARAELDQIKKNPASVEKLKTEPAFKARREMLLQIVAADEERKSRG
jgi:hypothetical protein